MELTPEIQELIEQYLNGQLQGEALRDFEQRIATDKALAEEVAFQREMHVFIADSPENELRKTLQMLSDQVVEPKEEPDKGWFWWLLPEGDTNVMDWLFGHPARHLAWVLPLLLVAGWWQFTRSDIEIDQPPVVGIDTLEHNKGIEIIDTSQTIAVDPVPTQEDSIKQRRPVPKPILPKITKGNEMASVPTPSKPQREYDLLTPPTIYWYNSEVEPKIDFFDPNIYFGASPSMDSLIMVAKQDTNYNIELVDHPEVIYLAENAMQTDSIYREIPLKLVIETEEYLLLGDPVLYVRDNHGNPYGPFPLSDSIELDGDNRYIVQTKLPLWDNTPRLIYYSIEDYETKQPYFVDKVAVLPKDSIFEKRDFPWNGATVFLADNMHRVFGPDEIPDFFAPDARLEAAIANNPKADNFKLAFRPAIPDTFYIPDSLLVTPTLLDSLFTFQLAVHSSENLFVEGLNYKVWDNVDYQIQRNYDGGYALQKKYGTDTYFLEIKMGYATDYPEGLYYYQIFAGSKIFTGKYIIVTNKD